jgi:dipeptidyl aminopeptidase/acylaminoacyl peptidase
VSESADTTNTANPANSVDTVPPTPSTPFERLDDYIALPRVSGLVLSPDGTRLITTVATVNRERTRYVNPLWELDPNGTRPARRLTYSDQGEANPAFTWRGDLLFTSTRPVPAGTSERAGAASGQPGDRPSRVGDGGDGDVSALWVLPAVGGEAQLLAWRAGGVIHPYPARAAASLVTTAKVLPGARDEADDARLRRQRAERKVDAILHTGYPVRLWDHDLGPDHPHLLATSLLDDGGVGDWQDLTPGVGPVLEEAGVAITPDGRSVVTSWAVARARGDLVSRLMVVDTATGAQRVLVADDHADLGQPVISPDGTWVAFLHEAHSTPQQAPVVRAGVVPLAGGEHQLLAADWDRWPVEVAWLADSSGLLAVADDQGRAPVFQLGLDGRVVQLTHDDYCYSDLQVAPDGSAVYALRSSYLAPPHPVRLDLHDGGPVEVTVLPPPAPIPVLPGRLTEVATTTGAGVRVRGWLALPEGADETDPAPLLLWIHGGPLSSWNAWSWRWNPWLLVARGYAVALPDPALSTGYGQQFVQRGWGAWGGPPYQDLMAITDTVVARPDIDGTRTAAMGGSFGGYMANWVAGHTDRFRAIVTHASLWALDQFGPTTDGAYYWQREMTAQMVQENSPHRHVGAIRTPMLIVHGDRDYRVPIGEGLRAWYELLHDSALPADDEGRSPHRFLYFPTENHWVLTPQHAIVWYQVVEAFLAQHVLGQQGELPEVLGR